VPPTTVAVCRCLQICVALSCHRCEGGMYHQACVEKYLKVCWQRAAGCQHVQHVRLVYCSWSCQRRPAPCLLLPAAVSKPSCPLLPTSQAVYMTLLSIRWSLQKNGFAANRKTGFPCPAGRGKGSRSECKGKVSVASVLVGWWLEQHHCPSTPPTLPVCGQLISKALVLAGQRMLPSQLSADGVGIPPPTTCTLLLF
jgi:hypothetical protein